MIWQDDQCQIWKLYKWITEHIYNCAAWGSWISNYCLQATTCMWRGRDIGFSSCWLNESLGVTHAKNNKPVLHKINQKQENLEWNYSVTNNHYVDNYYQFKWQDVIIIHMTLSPFLVYHACILTDTHSELTSEGQIWIETDNNGDSIVVNFLNSVWPPPQINRH